MLPSRITICPEKPYSSEGDDLNLSFRKPIWSYVAWLRMFTEQPLSINTRCMLWLAIPAIITKASLWGYYISCIFVSMNSIDCSVCCSAWYIVSISCLHCRNSSNRLDSLMRLLRDLYELPNLLSPPTMVLISFISLGSILTWGADC